MAEDILERNEHHEKHDYRNYVDDENFSDPEGYEDDAGDDELMPDLMRDKPIEQDGLDNVIVVDNIPQVGPDRVQKLTNVLKKFFGNYGKIVGEPYLAIDENGHTKGYMFLEYESAEIALEAAKAADGQRLDKQHSFQVNLFTDIDKYCNIPEKFVPPEPQPYKFIGNLKYFLLDANCCDQYSVVHGGDSTSIFLNSVPEPTLLFQRKKWTSTRVIWSPLGTYLATFHHPQGVALWAGKDFDKFARFAHEDVAFIDFSPCEKYLVTISRKLASEDDPEAIIIWDVRTGTKKRSFHADRGAFTWPVFKWSHDDKYFAKINPDTLSIYETPSMMLLDKKSIKIVGIKNFSWSPAQNVLAYWVAEDKDVPARVTLMEIPSKKELRSKNLFFVADCRILWQKSGDYLCVKVDRYQKARKDKHDTRYSGLFYNFEFFHMREKNIPVDNIELKENVIAFEWEPVGEKFAVIHGEGSQNSVSFYCVKAGSTVALLKKFEKKQCSHLFWSPKGQHVVLAGLKGMNQIDFIDTSDFTVTASTQHLNATDVEWDPTGRYVVTGVSHSFDYGYWMWSVTGRLLSKHPMDRFEQLLWRPRPTTLLSEEKLKEIKKNLKNYSVKFDAEDRLIRSRVSKEIKEKRRGLLEKFKEYREKKELELQEQKMRIAQLRCLTNDEHEEQYEEETVELIVKEIRTELN